MSRPDDTTAFLHAHGVDVQADELDDMVAAAIEELQAALYPTSTRQGLTAAEAEALDRGGFDLEPRETRRRDPLAHATATYVALLRTGLSTREAADRLGVQPSRIRQRLLADPPSLYGIRVRGAWSLPVFQFVDGAVLPGWPDVLTRLPDDLSPVAVWRWLTVPSPDLVVDDTPQAPREWLLQGRDPGVVARLAAAL